MKNLFYSLGAAAILLSSCSPKPEYTISGTVANADLNGKSVILYEYGQDKPVALDSAIVENGAFTFKGTTATPKLAEISFAPDVVEPVRTPLGRELPFSATFVLENGKLQATLDTFSVVSGTEENNLYNVALSKIRDLKKEIIPLVSDFQSEDTAIAKAAEQKYNEIDSTVTAVVRKYIESNPTKLTAGKLLYDHQYSFDEADQAKFIETADSTFKSAPGINRLIDRLEILKNVAVGKKFADFELPNLKGENHKLSEYVGNGKVMLIDFWASWCPPCRAEMPNLVALHKQYKSKGFDIVGISLDSDKAAWEKGISDLKITWPQLSDLKGWKNSGAALYAVNSIPHTILVDKDGTILAKNLHGDELKAKLAELLK